MAVALRRLSALPPSEGSRGWRASLVLQGRSFGATLFTFGLDADMNVQDFKARYSFIEPFDVYPSRDIMKRQTHELEYIKLCFVMHLCWIGPLSEHAAGLLKYVDAIWPIIAPHVTHYRDNKKRGVPAKIKKDTHEVLRSWLQDPANAPKAMALMDVFKKTWDPEASDLRMNFRGLDFRGAGYVDLYMPAEWAESAPQRLRDLCAQLAGSFDFCSGVAGYGLCTGDDYGFTASKPHLFGLSRHHPGLDIYNSLSTYMGQGIKGVNWLTFLHPNFIERMGGRAALGAALELPGVELVDLPSGVMIQAGPAPEIGNTNSQQCCPYYHQVGRVLAPIRNKRFPGNLPPAGGYSGDDEISEQWLSRFDG